MPVKKAQQNNSWKMAPFLRLLFPLIAGILAENFFPVRIIFLAPVFCLSFILLIFCNIISPAAFYGLEWVTGIAIQIAFFSYGRILVFAHRDIQVEESSCFKKNQSTCLLLSLLNDPVQKQNSYKCTAMVRWLSKDQTCYYENEKVLVYFSKKLDARQISQGSVIVIRKALQPIENFKTSDFDYKKFCRLRHIYAQVFLKETEYGIFPGEKENSMLSKLDLLRKKILIIIKNRIPARSGNSFLEALMVGYTDDLDPALLKSYADTGVIHIIAISGLHLALICHILQLALMKTWRKKSGIWIKLIVIVSCLWGYSLLSGASPSVIRAALMFSLVLFARNIFRESVLYNTLAASAFLLLCFDPNWIWDTGFQLSYTAVLSLRLFSKPVRNLLPLQNKILVLVWDAASVSIAAQILTTPISIYYFHRFPSYFLIANLLAVPLSSAILVGGMLLCIFSWLDPAARILGWLLGGLIQILNNFITCISKIPGAVLKELILTLPQVVMLYFIIFCFYRFVFMKEKVWGIPALAVISLFQISRLIS